MCKSLRLTFSFSRPRNLYSCISCYRVFIGAIITLLAFFLDSGEPALTKLGREDALLLIVLSGRSVSTELLFWTYSKNY